MLLKAQIAPPAHPQKTCNSRMFPATENKNNENNQKRKYLSILAILSMDHPFSAFAKYSGILTFLTL